LKTGFPRFEEGVLASVNHSIAEIDQWESAGFHEDQTRNIAKEAEAKAKYEEALRE
jgi:hypothetical protein